MNGDGYVLKSCKCYHSSTHRVSVHLSLALYSWMASFATFKNLPVSIQMIRSYDKLAQHIIAVSLVPTLFMIVVSSVSKKWVNDKPSLYPKVEHILASTHTIFLQWLLLFHGRPFLRNANNHTDTSTSMTQN